MTTNLLSIYDIGNFIGHYTCILFMIIMAAGMVFCMKKYLN
jgi:hypothetical protein